MDTPGRRKEMASKNWPLKGGLEDWIKSSDCWLLCIGPLSLF